MVNAIALKLRFFAMNGRGHTTMGLPWIPMNLGAGANFTTFRSPIAPFHAAKVFSRFNELSEGSVFLRFLKKTSFVFVLNASRCGDCKSQLLKMSVTCSMGVTNRKTNKAPKLAVFGFQVNIKMHSPILLLHPCHK